MPTASEVINARGGQSHPDAATIMLPTVIVESPQMPEPLRIVSNINKKSIILGSDTYYLYPFKDKLPNEKPNVRPEWTIQFLQTSAEQEIALRAAMKVIPAPKITREGWEMTADGTLTKAYSFTFPMPLDGISISGETGVINATCREKDLANVEMNPKVLTTQDHPELKAIIG